MSYDLKSNEETLGDRSDIAEMKDSTSDVAIGESGVAKDMTYPRSR